MSAAMAPKMALNVRTSASSLRPQRPQSMLMPSHSAPPVPQRNARRASQFMAGLLFDTASPTTATSNITTEGITASASSPATAAPAPDKKTTAPISPVPIVMAPVPDPKYQSEEETVSSHSDSDDAFFDGFDGYDSADSFEFEEPMIARAISPSTASPLSGPAAAAAAAAAVSSSMPTLSALDSTATIVQARRHSHEDKARLVSVVYSGKPSLVNLAAKRTDRNRALSPSTSSVSVASGRSASSSFASAHSPSTIYTTTTRPSTSGDSEVAAPAAASVATSSPRKAGHHKRNSSSSMLASVRARRTSLVGADNVHTQAIGASSEMPRPTGSLRSYTMAPPRGPPLNMAIIAATAATAGSANSASSASVASPLSSSPRTPSFGPNSFMRGVQRSLTLSRRGSKVLTKDRDAMVAGAGAPGADTVPPLPGQLPSVAVTESPSSRRKSLALPSMPSLSLLNDRFNAPPVPQTPSEHLFTTSIPSALRRASTSIASDASPLSSGPAQRVLSKKNTSSLHSPVGSGPSFFRRRSSRFG